MPTHDRGARPEDERCRCNYCPGVVFSDFSKARSAFPYATGDTPACRLSASLRREENERFDDAQAEDVPSPVAAFVLLEARRRYEADLDIGACHTAV